MLFVIRNWSACAVCTAIGAAALFGLYCIWLRHIHIPAPTMTNDTNDSATPR
jgi:hypothetical protein